MVENLSAENEINYTTNVVKDGRSYFQSLAHQLAGYICGRDYDEFRLTADYDFMSATIYLEKIVDPGGYFSSRKYGEKKCIPKGFGFANEGTEVGFIPQGCAALIPVNPNFRKYYGAVNSVDATTGANVAGAKLNLQQKEQLPYAYDVVDNGSAVTKAGVKSRPLLVPVDIDSFATFKNMV